MTTEAVKGHAGTAQLGALDAMKRAGAAITAVGVDSTALGMTNALKSGPEDMAVPILPLGMNIVGGVAIATANAKTTATRGVIAATDRVETDRTEAVGLTMIAATVVTSKETLVVSIVAEGAIVAVGVSSVVELVAAIAQITATKLG
ncbi:hypothetical protein PHYPSEUDO_011117 [Phytophthora pseudosyringae]|uniref:Uncharacterized protein n=1 Tax=Phytophthora pseudosyringae TaxID=221518 RepID=A0A8T1WBU7_9STRA|nr:hypothetical protein PHYPSEUDO_011117 [Phytophthora pseudosyringae]